MHDLVMLSMGFYEISTGNANYSFSVEVESWNRTQCSSNLSQGIYEVNTMSTK